MTDTPTKAPREHVSAQVVIPVVIIILGSALGNLSQTAMNAMFGGIAADFKVDMALGQWVTTLYMLVIGITVPVVTYLMRRFALKRLTIFSLCLFAFGCIVDVFAPSFVLLLVGRALQAVSAGILMPMMMSIIMTSFPPNKRATVMGVAGIAMGFAPNIGPTIGGYLVTASGWRSLFVILAICMIVLIICACVFIVRSPRIKRTASLDGFSHSFSTWIRLLAARLFERFRCRCSTAIDLGADPYWRYCARCLHQATKAHRRSAHQHGYIHVEAVRSGILGIELPLCELHGHHAHRAVVHREHMGRNGA